MSKDDQLHASKSRSRGSYYFPKRSDFVGLNEVPEPLSSPPDGPVFVPVPKTFASLKLGKGKFRPTVDHHGL